MPGTLCTSPGAAAVFLEEGISSLLGVLEGGGRVGYGYQVCFLCLYIPTISQSTLPAFSSGQYCRLPQPPDGRRIVMNRLSELSSGNNIPSATTNLRVEDAPSQWTRANKVKRDFFKDMSD